MNESIQYIYKCHFNGFSFSASPQVGSYYYRISFTLYRQKDKVPAGSITICVECLD